MGQALRARRQQLARLYDEPTWRTRGKFAEARGFSHDRTISDMENGRRDNYEADTIAAIEDAYEWQPGSIAAVLKGSPPTAKPPAPVRHDLGELDAWVLTLRDLSPQDLAAIKELAEVYLRGVKER